MDKNASFDAARKRLGIKRLFQDDDEILLNGEEYIAARCDGEVQVRDDDGETVLWSASDKEFYASVDKHSVTDDSLFDDSDFDDSEIDGDIRETWAYRPFIVDDFTLPRCVRMAAGNAFAAALGIDYFFLEDSVVRGRADITPLHRDLVHHWRDLCDLKDLMNRVDSLRLRINQRTGENKRIRID